MSNTSKRQWGKFFSTASFALCFFAFALTVFFFAVPLTRSLAGIDQETVLSHAKWNRILKIFSVTAIQALLSTAIALAVGLPLAFFTANRNFPLRNLLKAFSLVPLSVPSLIVSLAYVWTFGNSGTVTNLLQKLFPGYQTFLYSIWGIGICQGFYNFSLVMLLISNQWEKLPTLQEDSARILGARESHIFFRITLPKLFPAILSAVLPVFLFCWFSFLIVLIFSPPGFSTLEVEIYMAGKSMKSFPEAIALSRMETLGAIAIIALMSMFTFLQKDSAGIKFHNGKPTLKKISGKEKPIFTILMAVISVFFLIPVISIVLFSFQKMCNGNFLLTFDNYRNFFSSPKFLPALKNTLVTGLLTALFSVMASLCPAIGLRNSKSKKTSNIIKVLALIPMAVSSVVLAWGWKRTVLQGTQLILVLAQTSIYWPFAFRIVSAGLDKIPNCQIQSGRLLSSYPGQEIFHVILPLIKGPIFASFAIVFSMSAADASLPLVLSIPNFDTLSLLTYRLAGSFRFNQGACSSIFLVLVCTGIYSLSFLFQRKK